MLIQVKFKLFGISSKTVQNNLLLLSLSFSEVMP